MLNEYLPQSEVAKRTPYYHLVPKNQNNLKEHLAFREKMYKLGASSESAAAGLREMCSKDILFWWNTFVWTYNPRIKNGKSKIIPFATWPAQDSAILTLQHCIDTGIDAFIKKSRDEGASWIVVGSFRYRWDFNPMESFLLVSRNETYVDCKGNPKALFWKMDFIDKHLPDWFKPSVIRSNMHYENADNGAVIDGETTTGELASGDRRTAVSLDEFSKVKINDGYNALAATQSVTDCRVFSGTPKGARGAFYDESLKSSNLKVYLMWHDDPRKNMGLYKSEDGVVKIQDVHYKFPKDYVFIADGKLRSPWFDHEWNRANNPKIIAQEIEADFLGSGTNRVDHRFIAELVKKHCKPPMYVGRLSIDSNPCSIPRFVEDGAGRLLIWSLLDAAWRPASKTNYGIGADIAAGTGATPSTASVINMTTGHKVAEYADAHIQAKEFAEFCAALGYLYLGDNGPAMIIWESNGQGGGLFSKHMREMCYPRQWIKPTCGTIRQDENSAGWHSDKEKRNLLINEYIDALHNETFINPSRTAIEELAAWQYGTDGNLENALSNNTNDPSSGRQNHADRVIADALASKIRVLKLREFKKKEIEIPEGCLAHRMAMARQEEERGGRWL